MLLSEALQVNPHAISRRAELNEECKCCEAEQPAPKDSEAVHVVDDAGRAETKRVARLERGGDEEDDGADDARENEKTVEMFSRLAVPADADEEP